MCSIELKFRLSISLSFTGISAFLLKLNRGTKLNKY